MYFLFLYLILMVYVRIEVIATCTHFTHWSHMLFDWHLGLCVDFADRQLWINMTEVQNT